MDPYFFNEVGFRITVIFQNLVDEHKWIGQVKKTNEQQYFNIVATVLNVYVDNAVYKVLSEMLILEQNEDWRVSFNILNDFGQRKCCWFCHRRI